MSNLDTNTRDSQFLLAEVAAVFTHVSALQGMPPYDGELARGMRAHQGMTDLDTRVMEAVVTDRLTAELVCEFYSLDPSEDNLRKVSGALAHFYGEDAIVGHEQAPRNYAAV